MRLRAIALASALILSASPALAGIAIISGTGPNGAQTATAFNAGTSMGMVTTSSIPAGSLVVAIMNNPSAGTSTGFSCSDTHSNTYTAPRAVDQASGAATQILYSYTGTTINNGDTITCSQTSGPSGILGQILAFSGTSSSPFDVATGTSGTSIASGSRTVGPTATLACPGGGASCEVVIGSFAFSVSGTVANDATYTDIGGTGAGSQWSSGFKIVSATTAQSFMPSTSVTTNQGAQLLAFKAAAASVSNGLTTLGVGP